MDLADEPGDWRTLLSLTHIRYFHRLITSRFQLDLGNGCSICFNNIASLPVRSTIEDSGDRRSKTCVLSFES